jgi:hypothetical protein
LIASRARADAVIFSSDEDETLHGEFQTMRNSDSRPYEDDGTTHRYRAVKQDPAA